MATSRPSASVTSVSQQHTSPEYKNWVSFAQGMVNVLCDGLRPFFTRETVGFYNSVLAAVAARPGAGPCTCTFDPRRRPNKHHDMRTCAWAIILQGRHHRHTPNWKQSDATKWTDPILGPWEVAKLFLPDLGGHVVRSAEDLDVTGILNLMYWCDHFRPIPQTLIKDLRDLRNRKWGHVTKLELSSVEKATAFGLMEALLQDPKLTHDLNAQNALREIQILKTVTNVNNFQAQILLQYKEMIEKDISGLKTESRRNLKIRKQLEKRLRFVEKELAIKTLRARDDSRGIPVKNSVLFLCNNIIKCTQGAMSRQLLTPWLMILLLCSFSVTILDPKSYKDGCPTGDDMTVLEFEAKDFNMSEYLNAAQARNFTGRQWLYREIEDAFKEEDIAAVQVIGSPGSGKSALFSQLICSRTSSSSIHYRVLGYHLCKYSDKNTQETGKFVRNLAKMIARRLPEYGDLFSKFQHSFQEDCIRFPVGCFELSILSPLRNLYNKLSKNWFVVIDALDECVSQEETGPNIVYLLNNKIHSFPPWFKLIVTSRNESDASLHSSKVKKITIDAEDRRNLEDLDNFVSLRLEQGSLLAKMVVNKSQGNFLFVKELLDHWEHSTDSRYQLRNAYAFPKTLGDLYHSYFERLYPKKGSFKSVRHLLELLVSTFEPLTQKEIFQLLRIRDKRLDDEYDFKDRVKELGHFLKYGKNDTVTLYHMSLTEWLTSDQNDKFFVMKKKGHETFCDYYFNLIRKGKKSRLSGYFLNLVQHITLSGRKEAYVQEFLNLPSKTVNSSDPLNNGTLLHLAATINNTGALELLLRHFSCIDCVDNRGITPAFLAAKHGLVDNLSLLVGHGANINLKTKGLIEFYKAKILRELNALKQTNDNAYLSVAYQRIDRPVYQSKSNFFDASMLHAASHGGHSSVVRFLIKNNADISLLNGVHLTAVQIAAEIGHLELVKTLCEGGAVADQTALYHAAANNRLEVVNYLLSIGVKDECLKCDGTFYWLDSNHRFPTSTLLVSPPFKDFCSHISLIDNDVVKMCIDLEKKWPDETKKLYDDKHLILCHSALHAAVASGHEKVVTRLLSEEHNALNCYDYTGRIPLHQAVQKDNLKIVDILLGKKPQMIKYKCKHWQEVDETMLSFEEVTEYHADVCHCGYTPLHLAARYGHKELAISLIRKGARHDDQDCSGATPLHVAACHNQAHFISKLLQPDIGGNINSKTWNGSTPLHSAAACGAVEVVDYILNKKGNLTAADDYGLTALHYSIYNIRFRSVLDLIAPRKGHLSKFFKYDSQIRSADFLPWLDTLLKLTFRGADIDAVDAKGRTTLHIAARNGLADAVNVLLQMNASLEIKDKNGKTPLEVAYENAPVESEQMPSFFATNIEDLRKDLHGHEMVIFLLLSHGASSGKCTSSRGSMLHTAIIKKQFSIAQLLVLKGASLTCKDSLGRTPLVTYLHNTGEFMDKLLQTFTESVVIECKKPFKYSVFHLLSYLSPTFQRDNFFYLEKCFDPGCTVKRGPLAEAIESHPEKEMIISSCFDAEGFTPLHRAAQGGNLVAVRYLLTNAANDSIVSPFGHDALTLAVLYAGSRRLWEYHNNIWVGGEYDNLIQAEQAAIELLHFAMKKRGYKIRCDSSKPDLTLYHIAASRGLVKFIEALFNESDLHQLNADCANVDGITPMYLAKLFGQRVQDGLHNPWEQVIQIITRQGGKMQSPRKEAEYSMIYNGAYGWIPNEFTLDLRPDIFQFVTSLLTSFKKSKNKPFHCYFTPYLDLSYSYYYWHIKWLWDAVNSSAVSMLKLSEKLPPTKERGTGQCLVEEEYFRRDMRRCLLHVKQFDRYLSRISLHRRMYPTKIAKSRNWEIFNKLQRNWFEKELLHLMKMRHTELFQTFPCAKSLFDRFEPLFHLHDGIVRVQIEEYEKNHYDNYLNLICQNLQFVFEHYLSYMKRNQKLSEYRLRENELFTRPDFVSGRMEVSKYLDPEGLIIEWPMEFFLRRSLGFLRRYDYLKTLHVGIEPRTYVDLYSDRIRHLLERGKVWRQM